MLQKPFWRFTNKTAPVVCVLTNHFILIPEVVCDDTNHGLRIQPLLVFSPTREF